MKVTHLIHCNIERNGFRSAVVWFAALLLAALPFGVTLIAEGGRASLERVLGRLGADLLVVPEGAETKVETALLMGKPASVWMPAENVSKLAQMPGVAQVSPQLHLATLSGASCCSASEMFILAFDPATDFTLRPWLAQQHVGELRSGEVLGGSQISLPNEKASILIYGTPVRLKGNLARSGTGLDQTLFMTFQMAHEVAAASRTRAERELLVPTNQVSAILVKLQPGVVPKNIVARIAREMPGVTALQSPEMFRGTRHELSGMVSLLFLVIGLVWLLSVAVVGLIFSLTAHERRRELGVLRALGAPRNLIFRLLLAEAAALSLAGAACGIHPLSHPGGLVSRGHCVPGWNAVPHPPPRSDSRNDRGRLIDVPPERRPGGPGTGLESEPHGTGPGHAGIAAMLNLKQVTKIYPLAESHSVTAVRELTLTVKRGEFVVITGRSGSGKTSVLNLMAGLARPIGGVVELDGVDLWTLPERQQAAIRNCRMGFVFQFPSLLPSLTALENVMLPVSFKPIADEEEYDRTSDKAAGVSRSGGQTLLSSAATFGRTTAARGHCTIPDQ